MSKTSILKTMGRIMLILLLLYIFICSLDLMSVSFRLIAGKAAGKEIGGGGSLSPEYSLIIFVHINMRAKGRLSSYGRISSIYAFSEPKMLLPKNIMLCSC